MDLNNHIYDACTVKFAAATAGAEGTLITQPLVRVQQRLATSGNAATLEIRLIEEFLKCLKLS